MKKQLTLIAAAAFAAALSFTALASEDNKITVAASPTPHAEILEQAKELLAEQGYELEVIEYEDYVQPNLVVDAGEMDANYFQHVPYLDDFNEKNGTDLVNAGGIHYEPLGIYAGKKDALDALEDGDTIAIPNDTTNEARALLLLQDNGILTLKEGVGVAATVLDIEDNPLNIKFEELEAAQIARVKDEVALIVLNGNYALSAGLSVTNDAIAYETEDSEAAKTYVNIIAVKNGNENSDKIKALVEVLRSEEIVNFINERWEGSVVVVNGEGADEEAATE